MPQVVLLSTAVSLLVAGTTKEDESAAERRGKAQQSRAWSYQDPYQWQNIPGYGACGGSMQSPIPLTHADAVHASAGFWKLFVPRKPPTSLTLQNVGTSIQLEVESRGITLTSSSLQQQYTMKLMRWHVPSEHVLEGYRYPMERQLIFAPSDYLTLQASGITNYPIVIIAELYQISSDTAGDPTLERVIDKLDSIQSTGQSTTIQHFFPSFDFQTDEFYTYQGSTTDPPCHETVSWFVSSKVHTASLHQATKMRDTISLQLTSGPQPSGRHLVAPENWRNSLYVGNARPLQPINSRCIPTMDPATSLNCTNPVKLQSFRGPR